MRNLIIAMILVAIGAEVTEAQILRRRARSTGGGSTQKFALPPSTNPAPARPSVNVCVDANRDGVCDSKSAPAAPAQRSIVKKRIPRGDVAAAELALEKAILAVEAAKSALELAKLEAAYEAKRKAVALQAEAELATLEFEKEADALREKRANILAEIAADIPASGEAEGPQPTPAE